MVQPLFSLGWEIADFYSCSAKWGDVYTKLDPMTLVVPGARIAGAGVGGFLTGGKFPLLPSIYYVIYWYVGWKLKIVEED